MSKRFARLREHLPLVLLLLCSWAARLVLVGRGGRAFFPDEGRYQRSLDVAYRLGHLDLGGALSLITGGPDHTGFILAGLPPALIQYLLRIAAHRPVEETFFVASAYLTLASVGCIGLVYALAGRLGAPRGEALLSAALAAASGSLYYFSRHLLPYDSALLLALAAFWFALAPRPGPRAQVLCGLLAGLSFLTYNGYWILAGLAVVCAGINGKRGLGPAIARLGVAGGFMVLPVVLLTAITLARHESLYLEGLVKFAGTVNQGDSAEGWKLPWAYLWHAEHALLPLWVLAAVAAQKAGRGPDSFAYRMRTWTWIVLGLYALLVLGSTVAGKFVVYGRLVRPLIPFFCLLSGGVLFRGLQRLPQAGRRWSTATVSLLLVAQAGSAFAAPLRLVFPAEFKAAVARQYGQTAPASTIEGPAVYATPPASVSRYLLLNAEYLFPVTARRPKPPGQVLLRIPHPLQFKPYQYEGYGPGERSLLRSTDIGLQLIDTASGASARQQPTSIEVGANERRATKSGLSSGLNRAD